MAVIRFPNRAKDDVCGEGAPQIDVCFDMAQLRAIADFRYRYNDTIKNAATANYATHADAVFSADDVHKPVVTIQKRRIDGQYCYFIRRGPAGFTPCKDFNAALQQADQILSRLQANGDLPSYRRDGKFFTLRRQK